MTDSISNAILFAAYIFIILPLIGALFGGNHSDYGHDNNYENSILRGVVVHVILGCFYLLIIAVYHKITNT